jgi:heparan-alpha-glucosaminide N-acetyltransferase
VKPRPLESLGVAASHVERRLLSVDLIRGLDVLLMLFVNEMAGVSGTPAFLLHVPANADGMTITDVVFPAFLFITGMSIPLAIGARLRAGDARSTILRHVLVRSLSLIVIGVLMVNAEHGNAPGLLSPDAWNVLMTIAVLLVWQAPTVRFRRWRPAMIALGAIALVVLAFLFRSSMASGLIQLRTQWWGILGLIGWSYLVASLVFLAAGDRPIVLAAASALLYALFFADRFGLIGHVPYLNVGSTLGSHAALTVSGSVITAWLTRYRRHGGAAGPFGWRAIGYGAGLITLGAIVHQFRDVDPAFWISKPHATPAWCLISGGITCTAWAILYELADVKGWRRWPAPITIAGQAALLAYLLAPMLSSIFEISSALTGGVNVYGALGDHLITGTIRSALFALLVVWICGRMRTSGFEPKL